MDHHQVVEAARDLDFQLRHDDKSKDKDVPREARRRRVS
jgi:hypothetical protein